MKKICLTTNSQNLDCGLIFFFIVLFAIHGSVTGCLWIENVHPDDIGKMASVSASTQDSCCQYCLDMFEDTFAATFMDGMCTCLNDTHNRMELIGSFYTYITRDPFKLNQSDYECGSYGTITVLTMYFVVDASDTFVVNTINMGSNSSLSTSVLMMQYDTNLITYDNAFVGFYYEARVSLLNYLFNYTTTFKVGYVNTTTQFAMAYTRVAYNPFRLIVYLKTFKVVANVKNSDVYLDSSTYLYEQIRKNDLISVNTIGNDYFSSTADAENVTFVAYYNKKLMIFKEYLHSVNSMVAGVSYECFIQPNSINFFIPKLRSGASITFELSFYPLLKDQQEFGSLYNEVSALVFLNGSLVQQIKNNKLQYKDIISPNQARNQKFVGDMLSLLQFNDVFLVCQWAADRIKNYCGILSSEEPTTFTRLSLVFVVPICFDNITQNVYFEDKFGNVLVYNYLNKNSLRLSDTKEKVLQQTSASLPFTTSRAAKIFCCDDETQIGYYNGVPYLIAADAFIIQKSRIFYWVQPAVYIPSIY
ncbi:uncharacterized protein LOC136080066 [Hydra vulgaris]|uniref:Uncharacterized protein LOC136080066 n=1 Tax=Hydra vulgaris TaxID=6087 RepID=A0ABM4BUB3_HYDVU